MNITKIILYSMAIIYFCILTIFVYIEIRDRIEAPQRKVITSNFFNINSNNVISITLKSSGYHSLLEKELFIEKSRRVNEIINTLKKCKDWQHKNKPKTIWNCKVEIHSGDGIYYLKLSKLQNTSTYSMMGKNEIYYTFLLNNFNHYRNDSFGLAIEKIVNIHLDNEKNG